VNAGRPRTARTPANEDTIGKGGGRKRGGGGTGNWKVTGQILWPTVKFLTKMT